MSFGDPSPRGSFRNLPSCIGVASECHFSWLFFFLMWYLGMKLRPLWLYTGCPPSAHVLRKHFKLHTEVWSEILLALIIFLVTWRQTCVLNCEEENQVGGGTEIERHHVVLLTLVSWASRHWTHWLCVVCLNFLMTWLGYPGVSLFNFSKIQGGGL